MRIISGEFRHRRIEAPPEGVSTRPIPDRIKESLFGILRGNCEGASVVDCFAGTGAIGLEAISRGAARCVFVEQDKVMARVLERNVETLGAGDRSEVVCADALGAGALARFPRPIDLAFFDPPYPMMEDALACRRIMAQLAATIALLSDQGFAILRTPWPLLRRAAAAPATPGEVAPEPRRFKKPPRNDWKRRLSRGEPIEDIETIDLGDADESFELPADDAAPPPKPVEVELKIPGAAGPETHVYGVMAIHLYMRARNA